jgi:putative DNA primase/helicase
MNAAVSDKISIRRLVPSLPNDIVTEDSAALRFVERHGQDLRYCHSTGKWYRWNTVFWVVDQTRLVFQWARELARELAEGQDERKRYITNKTSFASGVERYAKVDPKCAVTMDYWDANRGCLALRAAQWNCRRVDFDQAFGTTA